MNEVLWWLVIVALGVGWFVWELSARRAEWKADRQRRFERRERYDRGRRP